MKPFRHAALAYLSCTNGLYGF